MDQLLNKILTFIQSLISQQNACSGLQMSSLLKPGVWLTDFKTVISTLFTGSFGAFVLAFLVFIPFYFVSVQVAKILCPESPSSTSSGPTQVSTHEEQQNE